MASKARDEAGQRSGNDEVTTSEEAGPPLQGAAAAGSEVEKTRSGLGELDDALLAVLGHPLRVRMMVSLNEEGDGSPSDLAQRLNVATEHTAYHMKVLKKYGFAELVARKSVGSATKSIYRALRKVEFPKEVWEKLPPYVQNQVIHGLFMTSYADAEAALLSGAYEKRPESHASWTRLSLDERGWQKLIKLFDATFERALKIAQETKGRVDGGKVDGDSLLNVSMTMSSFVLPDNNDPEIDQSSLRHQPSEQKSHS